MSGAAVVAAARAAIGAGFRPHGRDVAGGLDCVGLAALALGRAAGLVPVADIRPGDLLLCRSGPGQLHLAIRSDGGIIHADATARRVVERPGAVPWPVLSGWRRAEDD